MLARPTHAPGLRLEIARPAAPPNPLRTDIAGFAGPTQRGPVGEVVRLEGWRDYLARFGELTESGDTAFALRGYFDNGGQVAYVVRCIGATHSLAATEWVVGALDPGTHEWAASAPAAAGFTASRYRIEASSPGAWANRMQVKIDYLRSGSRGQPQVDILVKPARGAGESLHALSPSRLVEEVAERSALIRLSVSDPAPDPRPNSGPLSLHWEPASLRQGSERPAALSQYRKAAELLIAEREVALLAFPDLYAMVGDPQDPERLLTAVAARLETSLDRQLLAALPPELRRAREASDWGRQRQGALAGQGGRNVAAYHPWIDVDDPLGGVTSPLRRIAPVGAVAGVISRLDRERGAHHTPANAPLHEAVDVAEGFTSSEQGELTGSGVNLLRCQPGHGLVVWGGRTLADPQRQPGDLFLAHRRLIHRLVRAARRVAEPLVFNSNGPRLWLALVRGITTVLMRAYRAGALKGERPEQAFRVVCDETNNPPTERDDGKVTCEILVAPAVPMEFITLRITMSSEGHLEMIEP